MYSYWGEVAYSYRGRVKLDAAKVGAKPVASASEVATGLGDWREIRTRAVIGLRVVVEIDGKSK